MKQFKRAKVIILPTNNTSSLWSHKGRNLYYNQNNPNDIDDEIRYNIYIISDDKIKDGDWFMMNTKEIGRCDNNVIELSEKFLRNNNVNCKKIITTTDISLSPQAWIGSIGYLALPQPSQQFITKYIKEYNKGNIIEDILVEYERGVDQYNVNWKTETESHYNTTFRLKVNPKDNTINIQLSKDSWNREEVIELLNQTYNLGYYSNKSEIQNLDEMLELENWIEENL